MQTYRPASGGAAFGQILLRWGFAILGTLALWLAIDRFEEWTTELSISFDRNLGLWLVGMGLFFLAGLLYGLAFWLPVPGRGGRPSVLLGLGIPLLLINAAYAAMFHMDFDDLPDFLQSRLLTHPLFSLFAVSFAALLLGLAVVASFCPAGYVSIARLGVPQQYAQQEYAAPAPGAARAAPPPPPPAPAGSERGPDAPDNQQTRRLPPQGP
jgi:hypothetical protein